MKKGTDIVVKQGNEKCPRCSKNCYGCTSESKAYNENGELVQHYQMDEPFCSACAYCKGDKL